MDELIYRLLYVEYTTRNIEWLLGGPSLDHL